MEIVGLLVIVILITIILFFSLLFLGSGNEEPTARVDDFLDNQYIDNLVPSLLFSTSQCDPGMVIQDTVVRCLRGGSCSDTEEPCNVAVDEISERLAQSSTGERFDYSFRVENAQNNQLANPALEINQNCNVENSSRLSNWPFQNQGERFNARIYICM